MAIQTKNTFNRTIPLILFEVEEVPDSPGEYRLKEPRVPVELRISPFTLMDIDEIDFWLRQKILDLFMKNAKAIEGLEHKDFIEMVTNETRRVSTLSWSGSEGLKIVATVDGMMRVIWQAMHKGTNLTQEQLKDMLMVELNQEQALYAVRRLNNLDQFGVSHPT